MVGGLCRCTCNCFSQDSSSGILKHEIYFKIYSSENHYQSRQVLNGGFIPGTLYIQFKNPPTLFDDIETGQQPWRLRNPHELNQPVEK